ncbi:Oxidoreductase, short-chain dehydrogenase/reductase family [Acidisarcina polymorpha]|uniref:Oxidoreductase, short-chain dehydrogenase/reductase family n=1 Tax=Acidisarcina polymorpha TaxID=2211140 RepID=A0A2Z5FSI0_9BACT|nr:SDR family NAD(P)-dependent oxidoreductase [Acidisarcina polymorpha]AXC09801.1 Oxidoreductase, short-chain dehydrogenase/reductase family [Acidisarcina polymorpha]
MNITGNTILITGGTSGIGKALAEALHARQNKVIIAGRRQQLLDQVTAANPGMIGLQLDVDDKGSIEQFAAQVQRQFPELNVLINNAGIMRAEDYTAEKVDVATAEATLTTNISSVVRLTAALLPTLKAQPKATLMATTSGLAHVPMAAFPTYSGTKAFLHAWLEAVRFQLRNTNVEVLELTPPYVQTDLTGSHQANDPRAMPLDEFITEVMQILESGNTPKGEILVERVKPLRWAEKNGSYEQLLTALGSQ